MSNTLHERIRRFHRLLTRLRATDGDDELIPAMRATFEDAFAAELAPSPPSTGESPACPRCRSDATRPAHQGELDQVGLALSTLWRHAYGSGHTCNACGFTFFDVPKGDDVDIASLPADIEHALVWGYDASVDQWWIVVFRGGEPCHAFHPEHGHKRAHRDTFAQWRFTTELPATPRLLLPPPPVDLSTNETFEQYRLRSRFPDRIAIYLLIESRTIKPSGGKTVGESIWLGLEVPAGTLAPPVKRRIYLDTDAQVRWLAAWCIGGQGWRLSTLDSEEAQAALQTEEYTTEPDMIGLPSREAIDWHVTNERQQERQDVGSWARAPWGRWLRAHPDEHAKLVGKKIAFDNALGEVIGSSDTLVELVRTISDGKPLSTRDISFVTVPPVEIWDEIEFVGFAADSTDPVPRPVTMDRGGSVTYVGGQDPAATRIASERHAGLMRAVISWGLTAGKVSVRPQGDGTFRFEVVATAGLRRTLHDCCFEVGQAELKSDAEAQLKVWCEQRVRHSKETVLARTYAGPTPGALVHLPEVKKIVYRNECFVDDRVAQDLAKAYAVAVSELQALAVEPGYGKGERNQVLARRVIPIGSRHGVPVEAWRPVVHSWNAQFCTEPLSAAELDVLIETVYGVAKLGKAMGELGKMPDLPDLLRPAPSVREEAEGRQAVAEAVKQQPVGTRTYQFDHFEFVVEGESVAISNLQMREDGCEHRGLLGHVSMVALAELISTVGAEVQGWTTPPAIIENLRHLWPNVEVDPVLDSARADFEHALGLLRQIAEIDEEDLEYPGEKIQGAVQKSRLALELLGAPPSGGADAKTDDAALRHASEAFHQYLIAKYGKRLRTRRLFDVAVPSNAWVRFEVDDKERRVMARLRSRVPFVTCELDVEAPYTIVSQTWSEDRCVLDIGIRCPPTTSLGGKTEVALHYLVERHTP